MDMQQSTDLAMRGNVTTLVPDEPRPRLPRSILEMSSEHLTRLKMLAEMLARSSLSYKGGYNPLTDGDLFIIMLKGLSLGLTEMAALESIDLIGGKPCLDAQGMLGLIYASGLLESISFDSTDERCICTMKRKGFPAHVEEFGVKEATVYMTTEGWGEKKKTISLIEKSNYKNQARVMFKWRCAAAAARTVFPDVIQNLYTPDELGANVLADENGHMTIIPEPKPEPPPKPVKPVVEEQPVTPAQASVELPAWLTGDKAHDNRRVVIGKIMQSLEVDSDSIEAELKELLEMDDPLKLTSWAKYPSGAEAVAAAVQAAKDRIATMKPAEPKKGTITTSLDDEMEKLIAGWWDMDSNEVLDVATVKSALGIGDLGWSAHYPDPAQAKNALLKYAVDRSLPILVREILYCGEAKKTYVAMGNKQIVARLYGRDQLRNTSFDVLADNWLERLNALQPGDSIALAEPLHAQWQLKTSAKASYFLVPEGGVQLLSHVMPF